MIDRSTSLAVGIEFTVDEKAMRCWVWGNAVTLDDADGRTYDRQVERSPAKGDAINVDRTYADRMKATILLLIGVIALVGFFFTLGGTTTIQQIASIGCGVIALTTLSASAAINFHHVRQTRHPS